MRSCLPTNTPLYYQLSSQVSDTRRLILVTGCQEKETIAYLFSDINGGLMDSCQFSYSTTLELQYVFTSRRLLLLVFLVRRKKNENILHTVRMPKLKVKTDCEIQLSSTPRFLVLFIFFLPELESQLVRSQYGACTSKTLFNTVHTVPPF